MGFSAGILGVGSYLPEKVMTNFDLEKIVDTSDEWIVERTGIRERRIADPETATSDMSVRAAQAALADAGVKAEELDLIIVATATPDYQFPSTACLVQDRLGAKHAGAFDLSAGCSGFVYGLSVASQMIASGLYRHILVIGAETLSRIMDWTDRNTCVLFGDGAGALSSAAWKTAWDSWPWNWDPTAAGPWNCTSRPVAAAVPQAGKRWRNTAISSI